MKSGTSPIYKELAPVHSVRWHCEPRVSSMLQAILLDRRDRHHAAMARLAAQPAEKDAHQEFGIETIGLRAPVFARHRDAGGMDDIGLNIARPQPAR